jgi:hypothetical protein
MHDDVHRGNLDGVPEGLRAAGGAVPRAHACNQLPNKFVILGKGRKYSLRSGV